MITPIKEIRQALYKRLLDALPIYDITKKSIAWPNTTFTPNVNKGYLSPICMFGESETASLSPSGFELLKGIFQITIYGVLHEGEAKMENIASALIELYRGGTRIEMPDYDPLLIDRAYRGNIKIDTGSRSDMTSEVARPRLDVSINWKHYVSKGE